MLSKISCPLCLSRDISLFYRGKKASAFRDFFHCDNCDLVFVAPEDYPTAKEEKERYLTHNNDMGNPGYKAFLKPVFDFVKPLLQNGWKGLDYGCGPGPVLVKMFQGAGFKVEKYDPFFFPEESLLAQSYDFVVCTETVEHFHFPRREFESIHDILKPGGVFAVKTAMLDSWEEFPGWYYHTDKTHVVFYSKKTFHWLAGMLNWRLSVGPDDVVLFKKD